MFTGDTVVREIDCPDDPDCPFTILNMAGKEANKSAMSGKTAPKLFCTKKGIGGVTEAVVVVLNAGMPPQFVV